MLEMILGLTVGTIIGVHILLRLLVGSYKGFSYDLGEKHVILGVWGEFDASEWSLGPNVEFTNGGYGYYEVGARVNLVCLHAGVHFSVVLHSVEEMKRRMLEGEAHEKGEPCA